MKSKHRPSFLDLGVVSAALAGVVVLTAWSGEIESRTSELIWGLYDDFDGNGSDGVAVEGDFADSLWSFYQGDSEIVWWGDGDDETGSTKTALATIRTSPRVGCGHSHDLLRSGAPDVEGMPGIRRTFFSAGGS